MVSKLILRIILLLAAILSISDTITAEPVAARNVSALTRDADLIVVGRIKSVAEKDTEVVNVMGGEVPVHRMTAELETTRVLKGQADGSQVSFSFFISDVRSFKTIATSEFGIFFLRRAISNGYTVVNPYYPSVVALTNAPISTGEPLDKVTGELGHVLATRSSSVDQRIDAIDALDTILTPNSTLELERATHTQNLTLKLSASAALLRRNEISVLSAVANIIMHESGTVSESILWKITFAIENGVKDPRAIPTLTVLLDAKNIRTRRAAAGGLRHTGSVVAIPALKKALDDSDQEVRYSAVIGLAEITRQYDWAPSIDLYKSEESRYLTHWRQWTSAR